MPTKIIGTAPYQVPRNADLGTLAVQDADSINIQGGAVTLGASSTQGYFQNTDVSEVKPSLLLDFANSKSVDPRVIFSRSTTATYYDGKTFAKAEENQFTYSNFSNASEWTLFSTSFAPSSMASPDGSITAAVVSGSTSSSTSKGIRKSYPNAVQGVGLNEFTVSLYAKAGSHSIIQIASNLSGWGQFNVNLSNGATGAIGNASGSATAVGNGWYRIVVNTTYAYTNGGSFFLYLVDSTSATEGQATTSTGSVYVWGLQMERRSSAGAYAATTSSPIITYVPQLMTAASGIARIDHDPLTGECKGLLLEEQRTNLMPYSEAFDTWAKYGNITVVSDTIIAPNGTLTADQIIGNATGTTSFVNQNPPGGMTAPCTCSAYVKAGTSNRVGLSSRTGSYSYQVLFDLTASGSVIGTYGPAITASGISHVGNGWYRVWVSLTACEQMNIHVLPAGHTSTNFDFSAGTITSQDWIYAWGAQVETGKFMTSYVSTSASTATRLGDYAWMTTSGWVNYNEGTIEASASTLNTYVNAAQYNVLHLGYNNADGYGIFRESGSRNVWAHIRGNDNTPTNGNFNTGLVWNDGALMKVALGYKNEDSTFAYNGSRVDSNASTGTVMPNKLSYLIIGGNAIGSSLPFDGHIRKIAYYPKRLSNAELQEITL